MLDEVYYAMEQNKKVIPLIFVDSRTPFRLKRLQHIDFTRNYEAGLALLVDELQGIPSDVSYVYENKEKPIVKPTPHYTKNSRLLLVIACVAIVITAFVMLTTKNKSETIVETNADIPLRDTSSNSGGIAGTNSAGEQRQIVEADPPEKNTSPERNKKRIEPKTSADLKGTQPGKNGVAISMKTENSRKNLNDSYAGEWKLVAIEPKASSQQGYLKIEPLSENKTNIKSYIQFYYPESKNPSRLTVFNAFVGCTSCELDREMKLKVEDIAVGSRTVKTLQQDQPGGGKAGDVIMDASANKSIRASVTLHFVNDNNAVIKVQQPVTIALAHELMLEPFIYTFRFEKND